MFYELCQYTHQTEKHFAHVRGLYYFKVYRTFLNGRNGVLLIVALLIPSPIPGPVSTRHSARTVSGHYPAPQKVLSCEIHKNNLQRKASRKLQN